MADQNRTWGESAVLNSRTFSRFAGRALEARMTVRGAVHRTAVLLAVVAASAIASWGVVLSDVAGDFWVPFGLAALAGFIIGMLTTFRPQAAPFTAPMYAVLEGVVLGGLSAVFEFAYPGVVFPAVLLTFGTLFSLLVVYRASGFRVTKRFRAGVIAATGGIALIYLVNLVLQLLGSGRLPFLFDAGWTGIAFSLFVVLIAALNLIIDFELIERGAQEGAPPYMEWYAAFGVMVTLIWLYLEVLRLLALLSSASDD